jgi:hypothetical protein
MHPVLQAAPLLGEDSGAPMRTGDVTRQWPQFEKEATAAELPAGVYEVLINDKRHKMLFVASRCASSESTS